jgi:selenocysteine lyase/cysteine desulfurase
MNTSVTSIGATRLDMERRGLESLLRASVHYYNTQDEVERFAAAVERIAATSSSSASRPGA